MCVVEYESLRSVVTGDIAAIATYCCLQNQNAECLENQNGITQIESISARNTVSNITGFMLWKSIGKEQTLVLYLLRTVFINFTII